MYYSKKFLLVVVVPILLVIGMPHWAKAGDSEGGSNLPFIAPKISNLSENELVKQGCELVQISDNKRARAAIALHWQPVFSPEENSGRVAFCPPYIAANFDNASVGKVAGLVSTAMAQSDSSGNAAFSFAKGVFMANDWLVSWVSPVITMIANFIAGVALFALSFLGDYLTFLLTLSQFTSLNGVRSLWPVVLSIANLGFLLAMLIIALLVTLRMDGGLGVRKMLPRLFIGAILANFSLVICGAVLDVIRLAMAALSLLVKGPNGFNMNSIGDQIWNVAGIDSLQHSFRIILGFIQPNNADALGAIWGMIVGWILVAAVAVVCVNLLVRYIALVLLIIASPLSYLFVAFPGMSNLAKKWWSTFLKYALYGPAVVVVLVIVLNINGLGVNKFVDTTDNRIYVEKTKITYGERNAAFVDVAKVITAIVGLFVAATAGKYAGIVGSSAAMSLALRTGKRARGIAYGGTKSVSKGVAKGAYVGLGGRAATRQARDFGRTLSGNVANRLGLAKRDEKGVLKKGQRSMASGLADKIMPETARKETERRRSEGAGAGRGIAATSGVNLRALRSLEARNLNPVNLRDKDFVQAYHQADPIRAGHAGTLGKFAEYSDNKGRLQALLGNVDLVKSLNAEQQAELSVRLENNVSISKNDKSDLLKTFHLAIERAEKEKRG